tara:strand:+ start:71 stop:280 length:210 start_codon:yes stop_codon:yes gene_type:complete
MEVITPLGKRLNFKCQMCDRYLVRGNVYMWHPPLKSLTGTPDMEICEKCAKREFGSKRTKQWKELNGIE